MAPLNLDLRPHSIVRGALQSIQSTSRQGHPRSPKLKKMRASCRRQPWAHRSPASNQSKAADCAVEGPWRGQLCAGLKHMHSFDPPYAHNAVKPDNVLITHRKELPHLAILMDFESAGPARRAIRSQAEALQLQEWASEHCSDQYRAPELWECPSHADIDERTDIWSLGCTLYAMMYGKSPFDYQLDESAGESLHTVIRSAQIKWPTEAGSSYPDSLRQFITWMLQPHPAVRPHIDDIIIHVDKLITKYSA